MTAENPLLTAWTTPFGMPPFAAIRPEHYRPAFETAIAEHQREIAAIADNPEPPTFANTVEAMERAGRLLDRVASVFFNLTGAHTSDALEAIELEVAPLLSRHRSAIYLNEQLFQRIDAIVKAAPKDLDAEQARVLERYHTGFRRSGAGLPAEVKQRLAAISERLATLGTNFGQNVLADEKGWSLVLEGEDDLAGLPDFLVAAAAQAARDRGLPGGQHLITLSRSSIEPFLQFSARRDLREKAFLAWIARGEAGKTDNRGIIAETIALRSEQATLLGYESFAHFRLDDSMAKTPEAAMALLTSVWEPARSRALEERAALQALVREEGGNFELAAWDWRYYSERRRKAEFDLLIEHQRDRRYRGDRQADAGQRRAQRQIQTRLKLIRPCGAQCRQSFRQQDQGGNHDTDDGLGCTRLRDGLFDRRRELLRQPHDREQRNDQQPQAQHRRATRRRGNVHLFAGRLGEEVVAVAHRLHEHEHHVQHQRDHSFEGQLRGREARADHGARVIRQYQREDRQGAQHRQRGARAFHVKALRVVAHTPEQQTQADDAGRHDHDRGEYRVARKTCLVGATGEHDRHDQRHFDDRHGDSKHQRAERLADLVGDGLGVVHGGEHGACQRGRAQHERGAIGHEAGNTQDNEGHDGHIHGPVAQLGGL